MAIEKLVKVKITTPKGDKTLTFKKYGLDESDRRIPCTEKCPYSRTCELFPHPEYPDNSVVDFSDYCGSLGQDDDSKLDLVPVKGTLEKNLRDMMTKDHFKKFIEEDRLVNIGSAIDSICSGGWCDLYNSEHTQCTSENGSCILHNILKSEVVKEEPKAAEEEKKENKDNG